MGNRNSLTLNGSLNLLRDIHGAKFDECLLSPKFKPYFNGPRIEVRTTYEDGTTYTRRGRVSISTGYCPVFLLLPRRDSKSSSDILKDTDEITKIIPDWWARRIGHAQLFYL
jgi:hypothetical protein